MVAPRVRSSARTPAPGEPRPVPAGVAAPFDQAARRHKVARALAEGGGFRKGMLVIIMATFPPLYGGLHTANLRDEVTVNL